MALVCETGHIRSISAGRGLLRRGIHVAQLAAAAAAARDRMGRQHSRRRVHRRPVGAVARRAPHPSEGRCVMRLTVELTGRAHEMAQEEIQKQVAYLSPRHPQRPVRRRGGVLECDVPGRPGRAARAGRARARRTAAAQPPAPAAQGDLPQRRGRPPDVPRRLGRSTASTSSVPGQVALEGLPLALFRYFDRTLRRARRARGRRGRC